MSSVVSDRQESQCRQTAKRINHAVVDRSRAGRNETLMKLVAERVDNDQQERSPKPSFAKQLARGSSERARRQQCEDRVFAKVSRLANHRVNQAQRRFADIRKQPEHDRPQDRCGIRRGHQPGRRDENECRP